MIFYNQNQTAGPFFRRSLYVSVLLTTQILIRTLQHRVSVSDVLSAEAAFAVRQVPRAHRSVPGAVRVPGQTALRTGVAVRLAAMQLHQSHASRRTHIQGLLVEIRSKETNSYTKPGSKGLKSVLAAIWTYSFHRYVHWSNWSRHLKYKKSVTRGRTITWGYKHDTNSLSFSGCHWDRYGSSVKEQETCTEEKRNHQTLKTCSSSSVTSSISRLFPPCRAITFNTVPMSKTREKRVI